MSIAPSIYPITYLGRNRACPWAVLGQTGILSECSDAEAAEVVAHCRHQGVEVPALWDDYEVLSRRVAEERASILDQWLPPDPVPAQWLRDLLVRWECSQPQAAKLLRLVDDRSVRRWCAGSVPIPWAAAFALLHLLDARGENFHHRFGIPASCY